MLDPSDVTMLQPVLATVNASALLARMNTRDPSDVRHTAG
jgi:hypothetical protein